MGLVQHNSAPMDGVERRWNLALVLGLVALASEVGLELSMVPWVQGKREGRVWGVGEGGNLNNGVRS
jgi:hypothetical protein